ncbi:MAG: TIGR02391 family protein [Candidatus Pacebacteria bacterium]|nr:TIGR02391 family protein [Candidatus Paceibacterota bacterium]
MPQKELTMTFEPATIEHLGVKMYSTLPPVVAELIANSYDADAENVNIDLCDKDGRKEIVIEDDGKGMSFDEINEKFLRIGRNRRSEDGDSATDKKRRVIGKKGLGKLSFFGIAHEIEISTRKNGKLNIFAMKWEDIKNSGKEYKPTIIEINKDCPAGIHGTRIALRNVQRETDFSPANLSLSLSKIFIIDPGFKISIRHNSSEPISVKNEDKYEGLNKEIEWSVPGDILLKTDYEKKDGVTGHLIATEKPISPRTNMRGIVLYSRKKLVNQPEYFSDSTSSHFFSYLTGWLEVDFIDDIPDDVITTNRQSLNWGHPEMVKLRAYLQKMIGWLEKDWHKKRSDKREEKMSKATGINIPDWFGKLPAEIRSKVEPVVRAIVRESELPDEIGATAVRNFYEIVPEYPRYHWRNLHPAVQEISMPYYVSRDYYTAFFEAAKKYVNAVKSKAGSTLTDRVLLENVFAMRKPKLSVTDNFKKPDGTKFEADTIENIGEGHRMLVLGIWTACRCPIAHEEVCYLRDSGLVTEKDCLDALSLLSHLFYRLDNSKVI